MKIRLMVRGFLGRTIQFEKRYDVEDADISAIAREHFALMETGEIGMVEIEFLDETDQNARFFRIGVDPSAMVMPVEFEL
jgi:hypothetical protein